MPYPPLVPVEPRQESNVEIAARSCDIASMDAVQQLAQQLKEMPRVAGGIAMAPRDGMRIFMAIPVEGYGFVDFHGV